MNDLIEDIKEFCYLEEFVFRDDINDFGYDCVGIVCDNVLETCILLVEYLIQKRHKKVSEILGNPKFMQISNWYVIYFPKLRK